MIATLVTEGKSDRIVMLILVRLGPPGPEQGGGGEAAGSRRREGGRGVGGERRELPAHGGGDGGQDGALAAGRISVCVASATVVGRRWQAARAAGWQQDTIGTHPSTASAASGLAKRDWRCLASRHGGGRGRGGGEGAALGRRRAAGGRLHGPGLGAPARAVANRGRGGGHGVV